MTGFKEWALVCEALGRGEQSIILRKGGIAEGRTGFAFKHEEFFLFPTLFHEQVEKLKLPAGTTLPRRANDTVEIQWLARIEWTKTIRDLEVARRLAPFHIWRDEVIEERFDYERRELHAAFVRVYELQTLWAFPDEPRFGGCRSWVTLPDAPAMDVRAVLTDETHRERDAKLREILGAA